MKQPLHFTNAVLLVDDEQHALESYTMALRMSGIKEVASCRDSTKVLETIRNGHFTVCILDLIMPVVSGEEVLEHIKQEFPNITVIMITGVNEVETAVRCIKNGAFDYLVKPVERSRLVACVRRAFEIQELQQENQLLKDRMLSGRLAHSEAFAAIITQNPVMQSIFQYIEAIAPSRQPILVTGETGAGKELLIKAIHQLSGTEQPLVAANVAGIDDQAFADTLFGHVKGAFTGADQRREGLVAKAADGILHLDEIGDLSPESQIKLLRLLEEKEYFPLGSDTPKKTDARIIVSTNHPIETLQDSGRFRSDLFYRLRTHHIHLPPLREKPEDIPLLLGHFLDEAARSMGKQPLRCPVDLIEALSRHPFPGNIRELKSLVYDAVSRCSGETLSIQDFPSLDLRNKPRLPRTGDRSPQGSETWPGSLRKLQSLPTIEEADTDLIAEALRRCESNKSMAARILGISRQRLARQLKKEGTGGSSEPGFTCTS